MAKKHQEIMEILEAFDLTRSYRAATELTGTAHNRLVAMGFGGDERTVRRAVTEAKAA